MTKMSMNVGLTTVIMVFMELARIPLVDIFVNVKSVIPEKSVTRMWMNVWK